MMCEKNDLPYVPFNPDNRDYSKEQGELVEMYDKPQGRKIMAIKIYGDRKCQNCEGLCAGYAWRQGRKRKKYWCCLQCLTEAKPWITTKEEADFYCEFVQVKPPPIYI
jgi:hypothetical protein